MKPAKTKQILVAALGLLAAAQTAMASPAASSNALDAGTLVVLAVLALPVTAFVSYASYLLVSGKSQTQNRPQ